MSTSGVIEKQWRQVRASALKVDQIQNDYEEFLVSLSEVSSGMESQLRVTITGDRTAASLHSVFGDLEVKLTWAHGSEGVEGAVLFIAKSNVDGEKKVVFETRIQPWSGHYFVVGDSVQKRGDWNMLNDYCYTVLQNALFKQIEFSTK